MIKNLTIYVGLSTLLHLVFLAILYFFGSFLNIMNNTKNHNTKEEIFVETYSRDQLRKFKKYGIKDGAKYFSSPTKSINLAKVAPSFKEKNNKPISTKRASRSEESKTNFEKRLVSKYSIDEIKSNTTQKVIKRRIINTPNIDSRQINALSHTNFDIKFEPPEGVSFDELNQIEQVYFSFQKRIYTTYLSSFLKSLRKFQISNPQYNFPNDANREVLVGKITFDKEGNIKKIKMLKWTEDDKIQNLFLDTLQGIQHLPNPPKAFTKKQDEFQVYYRLVINE